MFDNQVWNQGLSKELESNSLVWETEEKSCVAYIKSLQVRLTDYTLLTV